MDKIPITNILSIYILVGSLFAQKKFELWILSNGYYWFIGFVLRIVQTHCQKFKDGHKRIYKVKDDYVRRDDVDKRFKNLTKSIDKMDAKIDRLIDRK